MSTGLGLRAREADSDARPSPLKYLTFWRVVLDEVQKAPTTHAAGGTGACRGRVHDMSETRPTGADVVRGGEDGAARSRRASLGRVGHSDGGGAAGRHPPPHQLCGGRGEPAGGGLEARGRGRPSRRDVAGIWPRHSCRSGARAGARSRVVISTSCAPCCGRSSCGAPRSRSGVRSACPSRRATPRSAEISRGQPRSAEVSRYAAEVSRGQPRSAEVSRDAAERDQPRSAEASRSLAEVRPSR